MVVSEATRARTRKDKAPAVDTSAPPMVEDASESSQASPRALRTSPPARDVYVTVDTLKSLMSTMADAITRQVTEQVKTAMEVAGSTRPVHAVHSPRGLWLGGDAVRWKRAASSRAAWGASSSGARRSIRTGENSSLGNRPYPIRNALSGHRDLRG